MSDYPEKILSWLRDTALPRWANSGVDLCCGGFIEKLTFSGDPIFDCEKRLRVQARQIYVFSHAAVLNWHPENANFDSLKIAEQGFEFLTRNYWHADEGGFIFSTNRQGVPADSRRESYEQAFAIFALAWFYRASGNESALDWAVRTIDFMDVNLRDQQNGGYFENLKRTGSRRQNPHMHLLEANLAMYQATSDSAYLRRGRELVTLLARHFFDPDTGALGEYFTEEWAAEPGVPGQIVEPGHQFEWAWLLAQYARESDHDVRWVAEKLYNFGLRYGTQSSSITGREHVLDAVLRDGTIYDPKKRLWVQTEAIKAHVEISRSTNNISDLTELETMLDRLFDKYLNSELGIWQDHLDDQDRGFAKTVPASSLYHVFLCLTEVLRVKYGAPDLRS